MLNLIIGMGVMVICLFVQALLVVLSIGFYARHRDPESGPSFFSTLGVISGVMLVLVMGNFIQIAIWAALFIQLDEFTDFYTAFYHSAVNFATLGYGDIVMSEEHRILGPLQSVNGVLMVGVSTAVMMSSLQDALRRIRESREGVEG
ncbi:potassium channel protein [Halioglobus maricola]|uniref:Potassium channel protein n=1 Tax=Halioglobus maricola TaxID=2601894 RepID=A0A5P9NHJ7_9GAMM|nr:potassium channel family protein [Halioglobus maricola]QFU75271.1 potassium channel protein [Halioglobus maricola]